MWDTCEIVRFYNTTSGSNMSTRPENFLDFVPIDGWVTSKCKIQILNFIFYSYKI